MICLLNIKCNANRTTVWLTIIGPTKSDQYPGHSVLGLTLERPCLTSFVQFSLSDWEGTGGNET